jgi:hypothetical protein
VRVGEGGHPLRQLRTGGGLRGDEFGVGGIHERTVEHDRIVTGVVDSEPHVGQCRVDEVAAGRPQSLTQPPKSFRRKRREQATAIGEVVSRCSMGHPGVAGQLSQGNSVGAVVRHHAGGLGQDHRPEVTVVVLRTCRHVHHRIVAPKLDTA